MMIRMADQLRARNRLECECHVEIQGWMDEGPLIHGGELYARIEDFVRGKIEEYVAEGSLPEGSEKLEIHIDANPVKHTLTLGIGDWFPRHR